VVNRKNSSNKLRPLFSSNKFFLANILLLSLLGSLKTISRNAVWANDYLLYSTDVQNAPNGARLHYWYADEVMKAKANTARTTEEKLKFLDLAINEFDKSLEIYPEFADAFAERGLAYYGKGDKQRAEADYKRAIDLKSGYWEVFNNLGVIYGERNNFEEAMKYFELALKRDSRFPEPYKNIGDIYLLRGDCDKAIEKYFEALQYTTTTDSDVRVELYTHLSSCYERKGDAVNHQKYAALAEQRAVLNK